ncbi:SGNH/GDSL hydrolase family protein [Bradyrhizobium cenepequi]
MAEGPKHCNTHVDRFSFRHPLPHFTESLRRQRKIRIVAIGSSSTAGEGEVIPYPARLELLLRGRSHDLMIDVLNRGLSGQEAPAELSRFEPDVFDEAPSLVIWQVGTNAVFRKEAFNFDDVVGSITTGLRWLADRSIDVVLMDLQYTPAVVTGDKLPLSKDIVTRIAIAAAKARVNVFRRFELMEYWVLADGIPIENLVRANDGEKLHMSDWATGCMTTALYEAIRQAVEAPPST